MTCFACRCVGRRLGLALAPVFPVRLCPLPSPLYTVLLGYKESPVSEARRRFTPMVRALAADFVGAHSACLASAARGRFDLVCTVPSSLRRSGSPLEAVDGLGCAVESLSGARWAPGVLGRGPAPVGHMRPDSDAYTVPAHAAPALRGRRVLVLDDTYVSGARAQSAAAALRAGGAAGVVIVPLGRILRPDRSDRHAVFLRANRRRPGPWHAVEDGGPCCRCLQTGASTE